MTYANPSILLDRNFNPDNSDMLDSHQHIAIINFEDDHYSLALAKQYPDKQFTAINYNFAFYQSLLQQSNNNQQNLSLICAAQIKPANNFDCVIIYFPKSKPEFEFLLNNLFNHVEIESPIYVVGDNKSGVKTCDKHLSQFCTKANKIDSAKHCSLYLAYLKQASKPFELSSWYKSYFVNINNTRFEVYSLPGVFSHGALDDGTELLLNHLSNNTNGEILDFGCGAGLIGVYIAKQNPQIKVTGLDVNVLAIASSEKTYQANSIDGQTILSDGLKQVSTTFDQIYSNPPFHTGVKTNYAITEQFIINANKVLKSKGSLTLVANSFLKYQPLLQQAFGHFETLAQNRRFNVYHAVRK